MAWLNRLRPTNKSRTVVLKDECPFRVRAEKRQSGKALFINTMQTRTSVRTLWVREVLQMWVLQEHHRKLLILAGEAWDRGTAAREVIDRDGAVYLDRFQQPKMRPEMLVERDMKILFAKLIRELDLDLEPPKEASRPAALRSIAR